MGYGLKPHNFFCQRSSLWPMLLSLRLGTRGWGGGGEPEGGGAGLQEMLWGLVVPFHTGGRQSVTASSGTGARAVGSDQCVV